MRGLGTVRNEGIRTLLWRTCGCVWTLSQKRLEWIGIAGYKAGANHFASKLLSSRRCFSKMVDRAMELAKV